ncbi:RidA family protein [Leucobacter ruminantium]|uniref:RidA family protein n=1 Tax=Leucobacter ruminantium TaxID=1289170 RepID=A0A939RW19_9MICO|nr:RidA family protein [Leucobacter ruminantium]MBO1804532.1 RidA family protein [Leucobacter ruminantium]
MSTDIDRRLADLGIALPLPSAPAAAYLPTAAAGPLLFISGQLPLQDGELVATGRVGAQTDLEAGAAAARACAIQVLAQARQSLGSLERVTRISKITVFVASAPDFTEQHLVANAASELLTAVLGSAGEHARSAVGVAALPLGAAVEVEAILEVTG